MTGRESCGVEEAYAVCRAVAVNHYENFPVVARWVAREQRRHFYPIYAFLRTADDIADEGTLPLDRRLQLLLAWQRRLDRCFAGEADEPIFVALAETVRRLNLPKGPFDDLLNAFKVDLFKHRYGTFEEVLEYCAYSANPVGRLVLRVMGYSAEPGSPLVEASDRLCTALQLVNHWQDVFVDQRKDRLYVPLCDMQQFGYTVADWQDRRISAAFTALMRFQLERTVRFFDEGRAVLSHLRGRERLQIRAAWLAGMRVVEKIRGVGCDVLNHRPTLVASDKMHVAFRLIFG